MARILVAEDDENDIMLLKRAFFKAGFDVPIHFVRDGQETVDYLEGKPPFNPETHPLPTMLLLDLKMPRLNGFDVLEWLRGQPHLSRLPVVVFTSSDQPDDRRRAQGLGVDSYLVKPQDPQQFMNMVRQMENYWGKIGACPNPA
jgi:CheY-like chemotaxis protein